MNQDKKPKNTSRIFCVFGYYLGYGKIWSCDFCSSSVYNAFIFICGVHQKNQVIVLLVIPR